KWLRPVLALANYFMIDEEKPHFIAMDAETQVEHILPQTPKRGSQWNADFDKEKREEWVNHIANLTLLKRKKNAQALNMDFDEKRKIYGGKDPSKVISCYDITKELYSDYRKWDEKSLQKRHDFLYEIITPVLHIEGQEEEFEEECEDDFDLE
ncbi:HNH endonuclease family protein, partial [Helicobacter pylori]